MTHQTLLNKNVVVVGLGKTGLSCVPFLLKQGAHVKAMDTRKSLNIDVSVPVYLGGLSQDWLNEAELIVVSPGVSLATPEIHAAINNGKDVIGDVELYARLTATPILAVTGSNGKSTVVTLLHEMLQASGYKTGLAGNIGTPVLELLDKELDVVVLELSSFQLETTHSLQAEVACVLNVTEDHMDRYDSFESYKSAKQRIYDGAKICVYNADDQATYPNQLTNEQSTITFSEKETTTGFGLTHEPLAVTLEGSTFVNSEQCGLAGLHNLSNVQAASAMALAFGADEEAIKLTIATFKGLPHRCQKVSDKFGVSWINDSKATNVGAALAAIHGFREVTLGQLILIMGGDAKQADLSELKPALQNDVDHLFTLGKDAILFSELTQANQRVNDLDEAVRGARKAANSGDTVLLSPACASIDMYKNYQERGEHFARAVEALQ